MCPNIRKQKNNMLFQQETDGKLLGALGLVDTLIASFRLVQVSHNIPYATDWTMVTNILTSY